MKTARALTIYRGSMAERGYSAFGLDPRRLREVLRPLSEQLVRMEGTRIIHALPRFLYFQLADAFTTAECLLLLTDAGLKGSPVGMGSIEVLVRRLIEQAIVVRFVHASSDSAIVEGYLKTSAHEWERSWGSSPNADGGALPVSQLPPYRQMAEAVDQELTRLRLRPTSCS
jgi:hypothetical protein